MRKKLIPTTILITLGLIGAGQSMAYSNKKIQNHVLLVDNNSNNNSIHKNLVDMVSTENQRVSDFSEARRLHGSKFDDCAYFVSSALRNDGYNVPSYIGSVAELRNYLVNNGWIDSTNINNLKPGDICFAKNTHTFIFVSWYNKQEGLANVCDNQVAYFTPSVKTYIRNLNGSTGENYLPGCGNDNSYDGVSDFAAPPISNNYGKVFNAPTGLHLRTKSNIDSRIMTKIPNGTSLNLITKKDGWYKINYDGVTGWVAGWYIKK